MNVRDAAVRYQEEGFGRPHPMPRGEKGPRGGKGPTSWKNPGRTYKPEEFKDSDNVGTMLKGDLVDIDLDCAEAVRFAPRFLPPTPRIHGRASKPRSHYWFRSEQVKAYKFLDIPQEGNPKGATLLEIRSGQNLQTMLPPSVHPSGEICEWVLEHETDWPGPPADWAREACFEICRAMATGILLGRHWPNGARHEIALTVGGFLASREVPLALAELIMQAITEISSDEEPEDRLRAIRDSYQEFADGRKTTGLPAMREVLHEQVVKRLATWYKADEDDARVGQFRLTEAGDADLFAKYGSATARYDHTKGSWLIMDKSSGIWQPDGVDRVVELSKAMMRHQQKLAGECSDYEEKKRAYKWYLDGESRSRLNNTIALAQSVPPLACKTEEWNRDPFLLGCPNGVVDLRTGELRLALPEEHVSMRVKVPFDPSAQCPLWLRTLAQIYEPAGPEGSARLIAFLQRSVGYSLTGDCREECCFFCWGDGANGKGTIMNTIGYLLGDYRDDLPFSTLEKQQHGAGVPNDLAKLLGKRFITCSEVNEFRLNESRLKALTGRDPITARFLYGDFFTFLPVCKIWLATNNKPKIVGTDEGIWRRIYLIPFLRQFLKSEANHQLKDQLLAELPGILAWAIEGTRKWLEEGLNPPPEVLAATEEYRNESSPIQPWISSCCVIDKGARVQAAAAYEDYKKYCDHHDVEAWKRTTDKEFHKLMTQRFEKQEFLVDAKAGKRQKFYLGIGLAEKRAEDPGPRSESELTPNLLDTPF